MSFLKYYLQIFTIENILTWKSYSTLYIQNFYTYAIYLYIKETNQILKFPKN